MITNVKDARLFDEERAIRTIEDSLRKIYNIESGDRKLEFVGLEVGEEKYNPEDWRDMKQALLSRDTISRPIRGEFVLRGGDGKEIDRRKMKIGELPSLTRLNTFVVDGVSYITPLQFRLKPGGYARFNEKDVPEVFNSSANMSPTRTILTPETQEIKVRIRQGHVPIYSLLKALDVPDSKIREQLGDSLYQSNVRDNVDNDYKRIYKALFKTAIDDPEQAKQSIKDYLITRETEPTINQKVLGQPFSRLDGDYWLTTARKVVDLSRGDAEPVNRDSLEYKSVHSIEDVIKHNIDSLRRSHDLYRSKDVMKRSDDLRRIINPKSIDNRIRKAYTTSSISRYASQANPIDILSGSMATTILGEGGITNIDAVPLSARLLQDSYMGFLDPTLTPESLAAGVTLHLSDNTRRKGDTLETKVIDVKDGKEKWITAEDALREGVAFPGEFRVKDGKYVPRKRDIHIVRGDKHITADSNNVKYMIHSPSGMFNIASNTVPFMQSNQGNRALTSAKMVTQAVSLANRELPLVETVVDGVPIGETIGEGYSIKSDTDGTVKSITKEHIVIEDKDGKEHKISLFNNMPLQGGGVLDDDIRVAVGDKVKRNQLLSDSNFTKDGKLAYGVNLNSVSGDTKTFWIDHHGAHYEPIRNLTPSGNITSPTIKDKNIHLKRLEAFIGHFTDEGMVEVTTWSGMKFRCTESHSLVCLRNGTLTEVKPKDIKLNQDFVPRARNIEVPVLTDSVTVGDDSIKLDFNFGELCGLYLAEGYTNHSSVKYAATDKKVRETLVGNLMKIFKRFNYNDSHKNYIVFYNAAFKHFVDCNFGVGADSKKIPGWCFATPEDFRKGLLSGYWAGDGCVRKTSSGSLDVTAYSNSEELRDGIAFLGTTLHMRLNYLSGGGRKKSIYGCRVCNHDLEYFPPINHSYKDKILREGLEKALIWQKTEMIPLSPGDVEFIRATAFKDSPKKRKVLLREISRGYISRDKLKLHIPDHPWLHSDLSWDRIKTIVPTKYEEWVFDLDMGNTPYFMICSGLFVHNTAYLPYKGFNFEDGIVISESAAKKLASKHLNRISLPLTRDTKLDLGLFRAHQPYKITEEDVKKYDKDGVLKIGTKVHKGDLLATALRKSQVSGVDTLLSKLKKSAVRDYRDVSPDWDKDYEGEIVDVVKRPDKVDIYVKTEEPCVIGDKLVSRHGNKGIISKIIPDDMTPVTASGDRVEVILDPLTVPPRINYGQILENAAGKLASKTGKQYLVDNFSGRPYYEDILRDMGRLGISEKETIYDPNTGVKIPNVAIGKEYTTKLKHQVDKKMSVRGMNEPYSMTGEPVRGGGVGGQSLDRLTLNALLAYDTRDILREMLNVKGSRNDAYWHAVQTGEIPPTPPPSKDLEKFESLLKTMGVNTVDRGTSVKLAPLLDKDIDALTSGEIRKPHKLLYGKGETLTADPEGLFGEVAEGLQGNKFTHLNLGTRIVKPAYKDAIKTLLDLTDSEYEDLLKK